MIVLFVVRRKCHPDEYTCANGQCIERKYVCYNGKYAGRNGCADGSHLLNCSKYRDTADIGISNTVLSDIGMFAILSACQMAAKYKVPYLVVNDSLW